MQSLATTRRLPPGPKGLPFIGNLLDFRKDPTGFLTSLARDYGDIAHFRLGRHHAYQLNHPDYIRDVLVTQSASFSKTRVLERARRVIGDGLLSSNGELHRRQRRLVQPAFQRQRISNYGAIMTAQAVLTSGRWQDGTTVDMFAEMLRLSLSIVGHTLFGSDIESESEDVREAMTVVFEYFNQLMLPFAGIIERLPFSNRRRFEEARALLERVVYRMIAEHRASGQDHGDLLSMLLLAQDEEGDGGGMSDRQARDELITMFLAGHETTATTLTWTWYLLAQHPEVEAELYEELQSVLGERPPTVDDLPNLEFTRMILAESMRIYPPVWTLTRRALQDVQIADYLLPAGSIVGMSQYVMHHDGRFFPNPERFDPHRWTPTETEKRPKYSYFPFGGGPRHCIGESFAWMEATLLLACLSQRWRPQLCSKHEPQLQPLITLRPQGGLPMILRRRSTRAAARTTLTATVEC
ncbi:MAG: cytochrome P450 [Planctomycetaceae bacterium]